MRNHSSKKVGGRHSVLGRACLKQDLGQEVKIFAFIGGYDVDSDYDYDYDDYVTFPIISLDVKPLRWIVIRHA